MPPTRVVLLGCGGVGRSLLELLLAPTSYPALPVQAVADSAHIISSSTAGEALSSDALRAILAAKSGGRGSSLASLAALGLRVAPRTDEAVLSSLSPGRVVLADCSAADTAELCAAALGRGASVALANKKPLADSLWPVAKLLFAPGVAVRAESTVGAGLPVHATIRRLLRSGDPVASICGSFSGTLGFVLSGIQNGLPLSQVVADAASRGYTEPDPRDDLAGTDVARKALILARLLGWPLEMSDVSVESLFPPELSAAALPGGVPAFMSRLAECDAPLAARAAAAEKEGCVLRYVATVKDGACRVGLQSVSLSSPLGRLRGTDNLCEIYSEVYHDSPLVIQGRGAGARGTASGVLADLYELQELA